MPPPGRAPPATAGALRAQVAGWLEDHSRLEEALECHAEGASDQARSFLGRCGPALVRGGVAARLIEVLRRHGTGGDPGLDAVLAEALQAVGEWDAAIDLFSRVERARGSEGLPAGVAWRYGVLLYLRGRSGAAAATLTAAHDPARLGADDAMVSAWLSTTLWSQGRADAAEDFARAALNQAGASGDSCALAAAHVSLALAAASRGERERNEQEYRLALAAARDGGDGVQLARIHANMSSRALESGDYCPRHHGGEPGAADRGRPPLLLSPRSGQQGRGPPASRPARRRARGRRRRRGHLRGSWVPQRLGSPGPLRRALPPAGRHGAGPRLVRAGPGARR